MRHKEENQMTAKLILLILSLALLAACSSPVPLTSSLPTPEFACPKVLDWRGIVPGKSTRRDVVRILGEPSRKGTERYVDGRVSYYAYEIEDGVMAGLAEDRLFFGRNGVVAWIEAIVADRDGQTHTVEEITEQLGATLDQVYLNNNYRLPDQYDVQGGPDNIYVWAECGLAVSAVSPAVDEPSTNVGLMIRHPMSTDFLQPKTPSMDAEIMLKFFFPQTSFAGFEEFYRNKVPFYLLYIWKDYLQRSKQ
jgi:outer membrane protein assembly factor BamE (lipoprotein component of BamABCDE complex)